MSFQHYLHEKQKASFGHEKMYKPRPKKRLLIIGHAQHGKDTVAEMIEELFDYSFKSSSIAASEIFLYEALKDKYGYANPIECFKDRVNHRKEWHDLICEYNREDKARLAKVILSKVDIYVGMRSNVEVEECQHQGLFDYILGVYDYRKSEEHKGSFDINLWEKSDLIIPNSQGLYELKERVRKLKPLLCG